MSDELIIFKKRLNALNDTLTALNKTVGDSPSISSIRGVLSRLQHVIRNAETLNTGGHFEWVDSKFVRALKIGQYICLEHVNLCSSAILDRLNPVFEPNGELLLSEKGVSAADDNQSERVQRHNRFRAFLTLDPKNGEISRAMRNRCVELNFDKDAYSDDDLKQLVHENGITATYLIEWLLRVHQRLRRVSEFSTFNVSHLIKFAFLTSQNLRLGMPETKAIFSSALEVYVRSSHVDLLGYGLLFYRNKLIQEIGDELLAVPTFRQSVVDFENTMVRANELSLLSLVRLQFEPLLVAVRCLQTNVDQHETATVYRSLRTGFERLSIDLDWKFAKYLLYVLYEIGSVEDNDVREVYARTSLSKYLTAATTSEQEVDCGQISVDVQVNRQQTQSELLQQSATHIGEYKEQQQQTPQSQTVVGDLTATAVNQSHIEILQRLNSNLHSDIRDIRKGVNSSLPWNQSIFTRLRDYGVADLSTIEQLKLSSVLLTRLTLDTITVSNTTKLSQINALTYSKAVTNKIIPDSLSIDLITHLHPFLVGLHEHLLAVIRCADTIDRRQYVDLLCAILWCNRLLTVAQRHLFNQKTFDDTIVDSLTLHFRWLNKFLLAICDQLTAADTVANATFTKGLQKLTKYVKANHHPLNRMRKAFVKTLTQSQPFYDDKQVALYDAVNVYENSTVLSPKLGRFENEELVKRLKLLLSDERMTLRQFLLDTASNVADELSWLNDLNTKVFDGESESAIGSAFKDLKVLKVEPMDIEETSSTVDAIKGECDKFIEYCAALEANTGADLTAFKLIIEILPVLEYFALRALNAVTNGNSRDYEFNTKFFEEIKSVGWNELALLKTLSTDKYKTCEKIWNFVCQAIVDGSAAGEGKELEILESLPTGFYKSFSSFVRSVTHRLQTYTMNSLAVTSSVCYNVSGDEADSTYIATTHEQQFINGPLLTNSITKILLDAHGNLKSSGLGELDIWRSTLKSMAHLLWNNIELMQNEFTFESTALTSNLVYGKKLLAEIDFIRSQSEEGDDDNTKFVAEFQALIDALRQTMTQTDAQDEQSPSERRQDDFYRSSIIAAVIGSIEVNLLTFMPLLDPVEKNRLKKVYVEEDQQHLSQLITAYEFMRINLNYDGLGRAITDSLSAKRTDLQDKFEKYSKKCALRPEQCLYSQLAKDVNHFLRTCCHPAALLTLLASIKDVVAQPLDGDAKNLRLHMQTMTEIVKRIELWISNAQRFEHHTLKKYATYYRDFAAPIETSISNLKFGLLGLKHVLIGRRDAVCVKTDGRVGRMNDDGAMARILENLVSFPSVEELRVLPTEDGLAKDDVTVYTVLDNVEYKDSLHFM